MYVISKDEYFELGALDVDHLNLHHNFSFRSARFHKELLNDSCRAADLELQYSPFTKEPHSISQDMRSTSSM
jgi:hypothetical protein